MSTVSESSSRYPTPKVAYKLKGRKGKMVCQAFAEGCDTEIIHPNEVTEEDEIATYGIRRGSSEATKKAANFWYMDHGYFGKRKEGVGSEYWRITRNNITHSGKGNHSWDRFNSFKLNVRPWRREGAYITVVPPGAKMSRHAYKTWWLHDVLRELPLHTDKSIAVCKKKHINRHSPEQMSDELESCTLGNCGPVVQIDLKEALTNSWVIITYASNVATEALIRGIPVIKINWKNDIWEKLKKVENPDLNRDCLKNLAYNQWTLEEIRSGQAWGELNVWKDAKLKKSDFS